MKWLTQRVFEYDQGGGVYRRYERLRSDGNAFRVIAEPKDHDRTPDEVFDELLKIPLEPGLLKTEEDFNILFKGNMEWRHGREIQVA